MIALRFRYTFYSHRASDISREKSKISRDFQGQIRGKIGQIRGIFAGKKSKFTEKSADFTGFLREKSLNSKKNRPIWRDFSEKSQITKDFQRQILRKIGRFHGKFRGETSPRNNQQKTADFAGFFLVRFS